MEIRVLQEIRCHNVLESGQLCNRFLGKINGQFEVKCPRCKGIITDKQYNKRTGE